MQMARRKARQPGLWVSTEEPAKPAAHPLNGKLNEAPEEAGFERKLERLCRRFYRPVMGRPGVAPGAYFRILLIGYCEGTGSERAIAWRVAGSLSLRQLPGYRMTGETPDHSPAPRTRRLYTLETHLAHKAEHAVDSSSGAIVAMPKEAQANAVLVNERGVKGVVAGKWYHSRS